MIARAFVCCLALAALTVQASAENCHSIKDNQARLECYDTRSDLHTSLQQMAALSLRLASSAADACGFVLDINRFQRHLLAADLTNYSINDSTMYSRSDLRTIMEDATASRNAEPNGPYCQQAWATYGPAAEPPDNALLKCRSTQDCR